MSETSTCKSHFAPFCKGNGADLGFGDDPINETAICIDRAEGAEGRAPGPYLHPTHYVGDVRHLPFRNGVLDYVFSSHVLEDFPERETWPVLLEWLRVIKPGGYLCLFLPDQPTYAAHCAARGVEPNRAHKVSHFGLDYVKRCLVGAPAKVISETFPFPGNAYSFATVLQKL